MGNAIEGANHGLSLRMSRNDFVADLLKMILLRYLSVKAIKALGLYRILLPNVLPIINKVSLHKQYNRYFNQKYVNVLFLLSVYTESLKHLNNYFSTSDFSQWSSAYLIPAEKQVDHLAL